MVVSASMIPASAVSARTLLRLRQARTQLEAIASRDMGLSPTIRAIGRIERRLARPLRVAILGEFNAGKSTLANVLAGIDSLPTAVVSATRYPTLLYRARAPEVWALHWDGRREPLRADTASHANSILRLEVGLPIAWLDTVQLLELPGLADPNFRFAALDLATAGVDGAIWCTASTQAWKESERDWWEQLSARLRNRAILVVTHADLLRSELDREKLLKRLHNAVASEFKEIVVFSAKPGAPVDDGPLKDALDRLLDQVCRERHAAALRVTARITADVLSRLPAHIV
jgi:hypothetical protein